MLQTVDRALRLLLLFEEVDQELEDGFNGVAVPVFDALGYCRASLSVSGPVYRMSPARLPEIAALCRKAAGNISASLGKARRSD